MRRAEPGVDAGAEADVVPARGSPAHSLAVHAASVAGDLSVRERLLDDPGFPRCTMDG